MLMRQKKCSKKRKLATDLDKEGSVLEIAVILKTTHKLVGEIVLMYRSQQHQQAEIGFVFNPIHQGHGYATEAAKAVLDVGFKHYEFRRIYARCDSRNKPSYKLIERLGMRREAHFIQNQLFKGEWTDEFVYALLQEEWIKSTSS